MTRSIFGLTHNQSPRSWDSEFCMQMLLLQYILFFISSNWTGNRGWAYHACPCDHSAKKRSPGTSNNEHGSWAWTLYIWFQRIPLIRLFRTTDHDKQRLLAGFDQVTLKKPTWSLMIGSWQFFSHFFNPFSDLRGQFSRAAYGHSSISRRNAPNPAIEVTSHNFARRVRRHLSISGNFLINWTLVTTLTIAQASLIKYHNCLTRSFWITRSTHREINIRRYWSQS
jgi:hypothetical protein